MVNSHIKVLGWFPLGVNCRRGVKNSLFLYLERCARISLNREIKNFSRYACNLRLMETSLYTDSYGRCLLLSAMEKFLQSYLKQLVFRYASDAMYFSSSAAAKREKSDNIRFFSERQGKILHPLIDALGHFHDLIN